MDTAQIARSSGNGLNYRGRRLIGLIAAAAALLAVGPVLADDPVSMAPPVNSDVTYSNDSSPDSAAVDSVFNWQEVPENQRVPINRAVFDQGGYQLYDDVGETIVVPFTNNNLYVMKFAISDGSKTYFVNSGNAPVLYMPRDGYLVNASVSGARWYPFSDGFKPSSPVYIGIAPSWDDYVDMGWYPYMHCYGGYWGRTSYIGGGIFAPTIGLVFVIGGHHYDSWNRYHRYDRDDHRDRRQVTIVNRNIYRYGDHPDWNHRAFDGGSRSDRNFTHSRPFPSGRDDSRPFPSGRDDSRPFPSDTKPFPSAGSSTSQRGRNRSFRGVEGGSSFPTTGNFPDRGHSQPFPSESNSPSQNHWDRPLRGGVTVSPTPRNDRHSFPSESTSSAPRGGGGSFRGGSSFPASSQPFPSVGRPSDRGGSRPFPSAGSSPAPRGGGDRSSHASSQPFPSAGSSPAPRDNGGGQPFPSASDNSPSNGGNSPADRGGRGRRGR